MCIRQNEIEILEAMLIYVKDDEEVKTWPNILTRK